MGLIHPSDLAAFQRDQAKRQSFSSLRRVRARLRPPTGPPVLSLRCGGADPDVLIAMDSRSASCRAAVLDPIAHLGFERVAVLAPFPLEDLDLAGPSLEVHDLPGLRRALPAISTVLSAGDHVPAGALAHALAAEQGAAAMVVQHGMLLPLAAPLPPEVHVATWSEADGTFWCSGRTDPRVHVLGSQLLFRAAHAGIAPVPAEGRPVYVGALHGFELPRREIERIARQFCRSTGARYRPHPSETDVVSRIIHRIWKLLGIEFADGARPLIEVGAPVVGMWSTGILEAAAAGLPAWVHHPDPPAWLAEVWDRYGLGRWGGPPTPRPDTGSVEPARRVAELLVELGG